MDWSLLVAVGGLVYLGTRWVQHRRRMRKIHARFMAISENNGVLYFATAMARRRRPVPIGFTSDDRGRMTFAEVFRQEPD